MIEVINGDHKEIQVEIKDAAGNVVDLTNYDIYFSVKKRLRDSSYTIQKTSLTTGEIDKTDPVNGKCVITLNSADTQNLKAGTYYYDIEIRDSNGEHFTVQHPDKFVIIKGVTD